MTHADLILLAPQLTLGAFSLLLLMFGAFTNNARGTAVLGGLGFALAAAPLLCAPASGPLFALAGGGHLLQMSPFTNLALLGTLAVALLALPLFPSFFVRGGHKPELYVLLTLSVAGMAVLMAAADMLTLYVGLELMSFPIYILAAIVRDDAKSSEAGLKYFVLGGLASGLTLFGISLMYAATGTTNFLQLASFLNALSPSPLIHNPLVLVALALTLLGTLFKLSVVPFHMWTPDVYEGAPTPVTALMSALPKLAAFTLLIRLTMGPFMALHTIWQPALAVLAGASMLVGATLAIIQSNLKRLLAFSTIANVGFVLVGVVAASPQGAGGALFYLITYAVTTLGLFAAVIGSGATEVKHLRGLHSRNPQLAAVFALLLFSLAGIPPLAGFMGKFLVFSAVIQAGYTPLAILGVVASVIALFYSLWLIKVMYFEEPSHTIAMHIPTGLQWVLGFAGAVTLVLGILPSALSNLTLAAATAIY